MSAAPALVVCDLVGTTVQADDAVPRAFADVVAAEGVALTDDQIQAVRGATKRQALAALLPAGPDLSGRVDRAYASFQARLRAAYTPGAVAAVPGAAAVIAGLRGRGVRVVLTTGFDRALTTHLLAALGWQAIADAVVCGDEVAAGRPAPDLILRAMALTGVGAPGRVASVGHTALDLQAGAAAGVGWNVGVWSGAHDRARLAAAPHTHLCASVAEVPGVLGLF
ncbi:MAG: HAD family hydrolase [Vicinamibacterales bacterium]